MLFLYAGLLQSNPQIRKPRGLSEADVHKDHLMDLFQDENGLSFNGQVAPLPKGRSRLSRLEVPPQTAAYLNQSFQHLYTLTPKQQATKMDTQQLDHPMVTPIPCNSNTSYSTATTGSATTYTTPAIPIVPNASDEVIQQLHATMNTHSSTLMDLRECCTTLVLAQKQMALDITDMNKGINKRFEDMVVHLEDMLEAIVSLKHSPSHSGQKMQKGFHTLPDINLRD